MADYTLARTPILTLTKSAPSIAAGLDELRSPSETQLRSPYCLTPYPYEISFGRPASSPLTSPFVVSPGAQRSLDVNGQRGTVPGSSYHEPPVISPSSGRKRTSSSRIPISLRMSSLSSSPTSPTDAMFRENQPVYLNTPNRRPIPLSPSAKRYLMKKNIDGKHRRPLPIVIPTRHKRGAHTTSFKLFSPLRTVRPGPNLLESGTGSVPLPRTPLSGEKSAKTAMPLTAMRIGVQRSDVQSIQDEVELEIEESEVAEEGSVPVLQGEPSPGWAVFSR